MSDHFKNFDELFRSEDSSDVPKRTPEQRPAQKRPAQQRPAQNHSAQQHPAQQHPAQKRPAQQHPAQNHSAQQHPVQKRPAQQRPVQHPVQKKPAQSWPEREAAKQPIEQNVGWDEMERHARSKPAQESAGDEWDFFDTPIRRRGEPQEEPVNFVPAEPEYELETAASDPYIVDDSGWDQVEPPIRKRRDGKSGCLGGIIYFAFVLSVSIILACLGWMAASDVLALNKEQVTATITLDKNTFETKVEQVTDEDGNTKEEKTRYADIGYIADLLKDNGIIEYKGLFKFYCAISHADTKIDPGTYELNTNYDYRALVKKMQVGSGAMVTTKVTFPEGYTMEQIFQKLEEEGVCEYDDLMEAAANYQYNYSFLDENALGDATRLEGFLFPDTYEFYQGMQASSAINKFLVNFHNRLTAEMLDLAEQKGYSLKEIVTIASMIEKEAANDDERSKIASVIYNRLKAGMPLQIDSTVMYVLEEHGDVLTTEQTQIDSPYNTYKNTGLPPTPIANPGAASINAALKPADTNYLFYALDAESGTHQFFTNYDEAKAFVAKQSYSQG